MAVLICPICHLAHTLSRRGTRNWARQPRQSRMAQTKRRMSASSSKVCNHDGEDSQASAEQRQRAFASFLSRRSCSRSLVGIAVEAIYEILNAGLRGQHTDSNQRLIYTWAWASPQKCRAVGLPAAVKSHLMTASF